MPNSRQDVEEQDKADDTADTQETVPFVVEVTSTSHEDCNHQYCNHQPCNHQPCNQPKPEDTSAQESQSDVQAIAGDPDSGKQQDSSEQDMGEHLIERGSVVSTQAHSATADTDITSGGNDGEAKEEKYVIVMSPVKDNGRREEEVSPKQSQGIARTLQLGTEEAAKDDTLEETAKDDTTLEEAAKGDTALEEATKDDTTLEAAKDDTTLEAAKDDTTLEAAKDDTTLEEAAKDDTSYQHQQVVDVDFPLPHLQARTTSEVLTFDELTKPLEGEVQNNSAPRRADTEAEGDHLISQEQRTDYSTTVNDGASQLQLENFVSSSGLELIWDKESVKHEMNATGSVKKQNRILESPLRQDLPAQDHPLKVHDAVQDEDTDFLHAFLTRAKAKKAAKEASPQKVDRVPPSPMTRSRAALVPLSTNSPSPNKTNKTQPDATYESEVSDTNGAGSPCRRSRRARLPRPHKAPAVTPSTIPVRRSKGTEFVFLQSHDTAQVALTTRTNTQRNKGEAVVPKKKLQALSQAQKSPSRSPKPRKGKAVSWKDEPTYFDTQADDVEEARERRKADDKPRARKTRQMGAANGTPAPKKTVREDTTDVRTPVTRKRSKVKS